MLKHYFLILLTFLLVTVVVFFKNQLDPRITYFIIGYALTLLFVFNKQIYRDLRFRDPVILSILGFLFTGLISTAFSDQLMKSLLNLTFFVSLVTIFLSVKFIFNSLSLQKLLAIWIVFITIVLSIVADYNTVFLHLVNRDRIGVSFYWVYYGHNHLSALLVFVIPIAIFFWLTQNKYKLYKHFLGILVLFLLLSLFLTFSRGSFFAIVVSFLLVIYQFKLLSNSRRLFLSVVILLIASIIFLNLNSQARNYNVHKYSSIESLRLVYWKEAIKNGISHPVFGTGLDSYRHIQFADHPFKVLKSDYTLNFFLQMFSDMGVLGLISSLSLIIILLFQTAKTVKKKIKTHEGLFYLSLWTGLLASVFNSLIDFDWQLPTIFLIFWILLGFFRLNNRNL